MDLLRGGNKLIQEREDPLKLAIAQKRPGREKLSAEKKYWDYHEFKETHGMAVSLGGGFDVAVNRVLAI